MNRRLMSFVLGSLGVLPGTVIATRANANPIEDAQTYVVDQTKTGVNLLVAGCSNLTINNGKNICKLKAPHDQAVLVGFINNRSADKIRTDYDTMKKLNAWNVASAIVGSAFIQPLPCRAADKVPFACGGFIEQKLSGAEIHWSSYEATLITGQTAETCSSSQYAAKIEQAYKDVTVVDGMKSLSTFVSGKDTHWREELTGDVTSMAQSFMSHEAAVIDLQAFIQDDGNMFVFDVEGLNTSKAYYTCWSKALIGISHLIYH